MGDTPQMHCNDDTWCGPHPSHPPGTATAGVTASPKHNSVAIVAECMVLDGTYALQGTLLATTVAK